MAGWGRWPTLLRGTGRAGSGGGSGQWITRDFPESTFFCSSQIPPVRRNLSFGFKHVESEGLLARVAGLWSQICVWVRIPAPPRLVVRPCSSWLTSLSLAFPIATRGYWYPLTAALDQCLTWRDCLITYSCCRGDRGCP